MSSRDELRQLFKQRQKQRADQNGGSSATGSRALTGSQQLAILRAKRKEAASAQTAPSPAKRPAPDSAASTTVAAPQPLDETLTETEEALPLKSVQGLDPVRGNRDTEAASEVKDETKITSGVPEGFFDDKQTDNKSRLKAVPGLLVNPSTSQSVEVETVSSTTIPKGFFDDKRADAAARGVTFKEANTEDEWAAFQSSVQVDINAIDQQKEEDDEDAADEREARLLWEQEHRQRLVESFRLQSQKLQEKRKAMISAREAGTSNDSPSNKITQDDKIQVEENSDEDDDDSDEDLVLDWRAKTV
mmetsp:Transcript_9807/g.18475  ORF Transcript_9807/g.18475 Transcript_9807/m.18475 type:complete len:303 (+) Transcript_9807:89-997(+)